MKSLIVIDDTAIRKKAFRDAELVIRKIDRLEANFEAFYQVDQKLFADWYALTFREHEKRLRDLNEEYRKLALFHNDMVTVARMHDVSMAEALRILRSEEALYRDGSDEQRQKIDIIRKEREDFLREEMEEEMEREAAAHEREERANRARAERSEKNKSAIAEIHKLSDREISAYCQDESYVFGLLTEVLDLMSTRADALLLVRIWEQVPAKHKKSFAKHFEDHWRRNFYDLIDMIKARFGPSAKPEPEKVTGESTDKEPETEYVGPSKKNKVSPGEAEEAIKILYRKLVRRLHPDLQQGIQEGAGALAMWHKKVWNRLQGSYEKRDHQDLEKIYHLVLIRSRDLTLLTIGEIIQSRSWLEEEFESLTSQTKAMKKMDAWGFSRLKTQEKLERKLAGPINAEIRTLEDEVISMKRDQGYLEHLSRTESQPRRRSKKKRRDRY